MNLKVMATVLSSPSSLSLSLLKLFCNPMQYLLHLEEFTGWQRMTYGVVCSKHYICPRYNWCLELWVLYHPPVPMVYKQGHRKGQLGCDRNLVHLVHLNKLLSGSQSLFLCTHIIGSGSAMSIYAQLKYGIEPRRQKRRTVLARAHEPIKY